MPTIKASIIVNNYNYARFLDQAIDSALNQTYKNTEVIVVDDGSTDNSVEVIRIYGERIIPVLKSNGGQASAFNAGFRISSGDVILFLDADDTLLSEAVDIAVRFLSGTDVSKVHWPMWEINERGIRTGRLFPGKPLLDGDLRDSVIEKGPTNGPNAPTSGNAWPRKFLEEIFPVPETENKYCADAYLFTLAPIFGPIKRASEALSCYRIHDQSYYSRKSSKDKIRYALAAYEERSVALAHFLGQQGVRIDIQSWKGPTSTYVWMKNMIEVAEDLGTVIKEGSSLILVDEDSLGCDYVPHSKIVPFVERDGYYAGPPENDTQAIHELERLREAGAEFIAFISSTFWWLDHYSGFNRYLRSRYTRILENDRVIVFELHG